MNYYKIVNNKIVLEPLFYNFLRECGFKSVKEFFDSSWEQIEKHGEKESIGCRIPYAGVSDSSIAHNNALGPIERFKSHKMIYDGGRKSAGFEDTFNSVGRFPANLLVSGEPLKGNTYRQGGNGSYSGYDNKTNNSTFAFGEEGVNRNRVIADKSNNPNRFYSLDAWWEKRNITLTGESAFFDVPKPSKAEKNKGLEDYYILKKDIPKHIKEELNNILNNKTL